jgi:hypothetical protein
MVWPRERCEYLVNSWREGWSFSELANAIGERFGICLTRSAIAGKINRMNLSNVERVKRPTIRKPRLVATLPAKQVKREPVKPEPPPRVPLKPRMIDILELTRYTSRYPYGDTPPYLYCGCPPLKGSPYCVDHTELCWNHPPLT